MLKAPDPSLASPAARDEESIGNIVSRLIDEGRGYAKAEAGLLKALATDRARALRLPAALFVGAFLFLQGAVVILCVAAFLALIGLVGPLLAGLISFTGALAVAGALAMAAARKLKAASR